jgi:hypothetical protein
VKLTALKASSVRGIPKDWNDLPIGDKGLIIYGPNGVGKSSIVDAMEFGLSQKTTLFARTQAGVNWETSSPHVKNKKNGPSQIAVSVRDGSVLRDIKPDSPTENLSETGRKWLETAKKSSFVLRRYMLLNIINNSPADRYKFLEAFFNMEAFSPLELALQTLLSAKNTKKSDLMKFLQGAEFRLRTLFNIPQGSPVSDNALYTLLNATLEKIGLATCPEADYGALENRKALVAEQLGGEDKGTRIAALGSLKQRGQKLIAVSTIRPLLENFIGAFARLEHEISLTTQEVMTGFLETGKEIIHRTGLDNCPLCEQKIGFCRDKELCRAKNAA